MVMPGPFGEIRPSIYSDLIEELTEETQETCREKKISTDVLDIDSIIKGILEKRIEQIVEDSLGINYDYLMEKADGDEEKAEEIERLETIGYIYEELQGEVLIDIMKRIKIEAGKEK